jgi:arylsulfatase A-like enzyme
MGGGGIPPGSELSRGSVVDVTPTVLHALGLPVARDMDGRVFPALARPGDAALQYVDSYETGERSSDRVAIPSEYDEAILDRLEALGYIAAE